MFQGLTSVRSGPPHTGQASSVEPFAALGIRKRIFVGDRLPRRRLVLARVGRNRAPREPALGCAPRRSRLRGAVRADGWYWSRRACISRRSSRTSSCTTRSSLSSGRRHARTAARSRPNTIRPLTLPASSRIAREHHPGVCHVAAGSVTWPAEWRPHAGRRAIPPHVQGYPESSVEHVRAGRRYSSSMYAVTIGNDR